MDISSLLEVQVEEGKPSELHTNGEIADYKNIPDFSIRVSAVGDVVTFNRKSSATISHDERHFYKLMFGSDIASVRFRKLHCTSCDVHIGSAPAEAHNMHEHPILHVLLCNSCRNFYGDGTFEQGDDATDMFCRWCANGGNLYCCSYCSNTFCYACIKRNFDPLVRKKIERDEKWKCFVCNPADLYSARAACWALLQHVQTVTRILQSDRKMTPAEIEAKMNLDESQCCSHKRKRADTPSDDEEDDETYTVPKRKRRKILNARRAKRRLIKLEMADPSADGTSAESDNPRQPSSNRDGRDESYLPEPSGNSSDAHLGNDKTPEDVGPKTRRRLRSTASNRSVEIDRSNFSIHDDDIPPPLLQCDQSMIEGAESLSFSSLSPGNRTVGTPAVRMGITPVPTAHLLKRPVQIQPNRGGREHRVIRGISGTPVLVRKLPTLAPSNSQSGSNAKVAGAQSMPMVSIPSRNHMPQSPNRINVIQPQLQPTTLVRNTAGGLIRQVRSRILFAKPIPNPNTSAKNAKNQPPSVIDLDSDEDEPMVVKQPSNDRRAQPSNDRVPELSTTTYPVRPDDGLMTILSPTPKSDAEHSGDENNEGDAEVEERRRESAKTFENAIRGPTKSINAVLDTLKTKLKKVMESAMIFSADQELVAAKAKTRAVNHTIKRTVAELTSLSDNLISAYRDYKRECDREIAASTPLVRLQKREKSSKLTTLDMRCIRESEPESDQLTSDSDSDTSQDIMSVREMRPYRTRVHRAVDARPQTEDKGIQVYEIVTEDYEKSIGYALLLKADYDPKRECDIFRPVAVPDENFGKYEDEFISYLQYLEDRRNDENITDEDDKAAIVSVNDLVETDLFAAPKAIDEIETICSNEIDNEQNKKTNDDTVEILDEHLEISIPTTGTQSSSSDSDSDSSSSDSETGTSETTSPLKADPEKIQEEEKNETQVTEMETSVTEEPQTENEKKETTPSENNASKKRDKPAEEETILAVRALIDEDSSENSNSNAPLKPWKPVDSDDECTVLD